MSRWLLKALLFICPAMLIANDNITSVITSIQQQGPSNVANMQQQRQKSAVEIPEESIRDLEQMNQITQERRGVISQEQIEEIKDPFAASKPGADLNKNFELQATVGRSAKINGTWYKLNDEIEQYKLVKIQPKEVTLNDPNADANLTIELKKGSNVTISDI